MSWQSPRSWMRVLSAAVLVGVIDVVVLVGAIAWATKVGYVAQIFGGAVGVIAVVTFVGFFKEFAPSHDGQMRAAITASFLMVYLFIFGLVAFSPQLQQLVNGAYGDSNQNERLEPVDGEPTETPAVDGNVAKDMFDSLSGVVTAIVAFYFGGAALEGAASKLGGARAAERSVAGATPDEASPPPPVPPPTGSLP